MPGLEIFRTSTFRLAFASGAAFAACVVMLSGLVYWQVGGYETEQVDRFVERKLSDIAAADAQAIIARLAATDRTGRQGAAYFGLFMPDGNPVAGNIPHLPPGIRTDGKARQLDALVPEEASPVRAAALTLPDGRILLIARDVAEIDELQQAVLEALEIGVAPALVLSLAVGYLLGRNAIQRVRAVRRTIERIMGGSLNDRLETSSRGDDFDRLAASVNRMLDEIGRLLDEVAGIGDDIAHDLRTPLTRVRTRLERVRQQSHTEHELRDAIDAAILGLDQALGIITALLRIGEIEDGRRRAAFGDADLAALARDIAELYEPVAEAAGVALALETSGRLSIFGDRDLLIEAVANIIDNAIKFTPSGGRVRVSVFERGGRAVVAVEDSGPGIPPEEREAVLKRFYRADKSRHHFGNGLGLGIVQAIVTLHGFDLTIGDAAPGCRFEIVCTPAPQRSRPATNPE